MHLQEIPVSGPLLPAVTADNAPAGSPRELHELVGGNRFRRASSEIAALAQWQRVEIAALALLLHLLLCCAGGGRGWASAAVLAANSQPGLLSSELALGGSPLPHHHGGAEGVAAAERCAGAMAASMGALRGGMNDREEDIEAFTAKQLALVELECAAEETAATEEQQSFTLKQLEVRTRAPGGGILRLKPGRPASPVCACVSLACAQMTLRAKRPETRQPAERIDICTAQEKGVVLSGLLVDERKHGLGGHTLLTLVRSKALSSESSQKHGEPLLPQVCRLTIAFIVSARTLCAKVCECQTRLLLRLCRSARLMPTA